jgi:hypothetical protein
MRSVSRIPSKTREKVRLNDGKFGKFSVRLDLGTSLNSSPTCPRRSGLAKNHEQVKIGLQSAAIWRMSVQIISAFPNSSLSRGRRLFEPVGWRTFDDQNTWGFAREAPLSSNMSRGYYITHQSVIRTTLPLSSISDYDSKGHEARRTKARSPNIGIHPVHGGRARARR